MVTVQNIYLQSLCNELAIPLASPLILHFHFRDCQDDIHVCIQVYCFLLKKIEEGENGDKTQ